MGLGLGAVHPKLSGSTIDTETRERVKWGLSSYATESQSIVCRTVEGYHVRASDFHEDYVLQQLLQPRGSTSRMNFA
ncbi:hypothetical protein LSAT2_016671 [Lamellibrachia satsuma]|nr:hypothetical protein LSAT2_016671 [Lamellibrachia satsuma]